MRLILRGCPYCTPGDLAYDILEKEWRCLNCARVVALTIVEQLREKRRMLAPPHQ